MIKACLRRLGSLFGIAGPGRCRSCGNRPGYGRRWECPACGVPTFPVPNEAKKAAAAAEGEENLIVLGRDLGEKLLPVFGLQGQAVKRLVLTLDVGGAACLEVTRFVRKGEADGVAREVTSFLNVNDFREYTLEPYEEVTERLAIVRRRKEEGR